MKKKLILLLLVVVIAGAGIFGIASRNKSNKDILPGIWEASESTYGYPDILSLYDNGTGTADGDLNLSYSATEMMLTLVINVSDRTETFEYFYHVIDKNQIQLISLEEPEYTTDYGVIFFKK